MKKSLIALAVLAASGAAMAQSSVTMFGVVDTGVAYLKGTNGGNSNYGLTTGGNASSRLGFRGVEDLGGGLKAGFWLESGFNSDTGNGKAAGASGNGLEFARRSTVSLMGNFGEVRLGRDETAAYNKLSAYSNFSVIGVGGFRGWNSTIGDGIRQNNMIAYFTPNFSGFTAGVNYVFGEVAGSSATARYVGGFAAYNNGPLSVTIGADHKNGAAYGNGKSHQLSLGYVHNLSKRTALYGTYSYLKNKDNRTMTVIDSGAGAYNVGANGSNHGVQVGIRHAF